MSAEYIMSEGNPNVIFCERGIRTFETYTRNTLDLSAVLAVKRLSHLPVVVDPSRLRPGLDGGTHGHGGWPPGGRLDHRGPQRSAPCPCAMGRSPSLRTSLPSSWTEWVHRLRGALSVTVHRKGSPFSSALPAEHFAPSPGRVDDFRAERRGFEELDQYGKKDDFSGGAGPDWRLPVHGPSRL